METLNNNPQKVVVVSGGFDPVHSGHVKFFEAAKQLGDKLIVALNSDAWLTRKKGQPFMPWEERAVVVEALKPVDEVISFDDNDSQGTALDALLKIRTRFPDTQIIFANGGDRTDRNVPEMQLNDDHLSFVFGVGGINKQNSSSQLLSKWTEWQMEKKLT